MTYRLENALLFSSEEQLCHLLHLRKRFKERSQIQSDNEKMSLNPMTYLNYFGSVHSQNLCSILHVFNAVFHFIHLSPAALSHIVYYSCEALNVNLELHADSHHNLLQYSITFTKLFYATFFQLNLIISSHRHCSRDGM